MDPRQNYRNTYHSVLATLRSLDPLGHIAKYEGERAEAHAYSYEATAIVERLRRHPTPEAVQALLLELCGTGTNLDMGLIEVASGHVAEALERLQG